MRIAPTITLSEEDRRTLESWSRGRSTPARLVQRAKIVILAASGASLQPWLAVTVGVLLVLGGVALAGIRAPGRRRRSE